MNSVKRIPMRVVAGGNGQIVALAEGFQISDVAASMLPSIHLVKSAFGTEIEH